MSDLWREPDSRSDDNWAVWYGPAGQDGDCATECERQFDGFVVREFQHVGGLIEDYDEDQPFLCIETWVSDEEANNLCKAVGIGVDRIREQGGPESFVESLPT